MILSDLAGTSDWEIARFTEDVPARSTSPVTVPLSQASTNCYLELRGDENRYLTSPIFAVSKGNGTKTTWSSSSQSGEQGDPMVSSAMAQATATTNGNHLERLDLISHCQQTA